LSWVQRGNAGVELKTALHLSASARYDVAMNVWRGLFRLWIVASCLWAMLVALISWRGIYEPYLPEAAYELSSTLEVQWAPHRAYLVSTPPGYTRIQFPNQIVVFASSDIPQSTLNEWAPRFTARYTALRNSQVSAARFSALTNAAMATVLIPLAFLGLGGALRWVVRGFIKLP
jgi:hypothetical protein